MIELTINNVDIAEYVTKIHFESSPDQKRNSGFTNYDGTTVYGVDGQSFKHTIQVTAEGVPDSTAADLDDELHSGTVSVLYTSPASSTGYFACTAYSAEPDEGSHEDGSDPDWNITFTLESVSETSGDGL